MCDIQNKQFQYSNSICFKENTLEEWLRSVF